MYHPYSPVTDTCGLHEIELTLLSSCGCFLIVTTQLQIMVLPLCVTAGSRHSDRQIMVLPLCVAAGSHHSDSADGTLTRITVGWSILTSLPKIPNIRTGVKDGPWLSSLATVIDCDYTFWLTCMAPEPLFNHWQEEGLHVSKVTLSPIQFILVWRRTLAWSWDLIDMRECVHANMAAFSCDGAHARHDYEALFCKLSGRHVLLKYVGILCSETILKSIRDHLH